MKLGGNAYLVLIFFIILQRNDKDLINLDDIQALSHTELVK